MYAVVHIVKCCLATITVFLTYVKDDNGDSPLDVAVRRDRLEIVYYLIDHGEDKDKAFILACQSGSLKVVEGLVEQHNVNPKGEQNTIIAEHWCKNCFGVHNVNKELVW